MNQQNLARYFSINFFLLYLQFIFWESNPLCLGRKLLFLSVSKDEPIGFLTEYNSTWNNIF